MTGSGLEPDWFYRLDLDRFKTGSRHWIGTSIRLVLEIELRLVVDTGSGSREWTAAPADFE